MDETGKVISPESLVLTFTKDSKQNTYETILSAEEAAEYNIDNVFKNWTPDEYAAQKQISKLNAEGTTLTWDAVDGAVAYAVFYNGQFVAMTSANTLTFAVEGDESSLNNYTVRTANQHGGFGPAVSTTSTGITGVVTDSGNVVKTAYYSLQGSRVSDTYAGVVIKVDTMTDGSVKTTKIIK